MTSRTKLPSTLVVLAVAALALAACGRAGAPTAVNPNAVEGQEDAPAPTVEDKPFVLDPLLN
ncbi:MAG: hypothetical protein WA921_14840 [Ahrensia sp.]